jgi:tetratricopeptide (TPR) repeat protein
VSRLLVIAWENADWTLLQPLLDRGLLPNLAALIRRGAIGDLATLQPQLEPLLWTSLATGTRADRHGVLHAWQASAGHQLQATNSTSVARPALWDCVSGCNEIPLVVNWPLTYPAFSRTGVIASELVCRLAGDTSGLEPLAEGAVSPKTWSANLEELRFSPAEVDPSSLAYFVPHWESAAKDADPLLNRVRVAIAETVTTHAAMTEMLTRSDWRLAIVRYELLALLGPAFFALHPPQLHYVADADYDRYCGVLDAACRYLDLMLGVLIEMSPGDTEVMLISERGVSLGEHRPEDAETAFNTMGGAPWYRQHGIIVAAGDKIRQGAQIQGAGLLDIAPTALALMELPAPAGLDGRVLDELFVEAPLQASPPLTASPEAYGRHLSLSHIEALKNRRLETDAYLPEGDSETVSALIRQETEFNAAMVALDARDFRRARELLEYLHREHPDDERVAIHLARCRRRDGDSDGARALLDAVIDNPRLRPYELMQLARMDVAAGEHNAALVKLFRAEQAEGQRPQVHCQIGEVYLAMSRWEEAERAFKKAIERDARLALAWRGMTAVHLSQQRFPDAVQAALRAVELERKSPQGHYLLACALTEDGQYRLAIASCDTCLEVAPEHVGALQLAIKLHERGGHHDWAAEYRQRLTAVTTRRAVAKQMQEFSG